MRTRNLGLVAAAAGLVLCAAGAGVARADDARERDLEARLKEVEKRLADAERGGYFTANSDLEARIAELERNSLSDDKNAMVSYFKQGMKSESADGATSYRWLGFVQQDFIWYWDGGNEDIRAATGPTSGDLQNAEFGFRRVRLGVEGKYYGNVKWVVVMDYAKAAINFADVFMEVTNCGIGNIRVGHFKHPWGMESLESDLYNHFIERGAVDRAFGMARDSGIMVYGNAMDDTMLYQAGIFRNSNAGGDDLDSARSGEYNFTGRLSGRPLIEDDGATWLHMGIAAAYRDFDGGANNVADTLTLNATSPIPQSTTLGSATIKCDKGWQVGLETAFNTGPFIVRGEWAKFNGDGDNRHLATATGAGTDVDFKAWYLEAAYWLTGENTQYSKGSGTIGSTKPKKNFGDGDGMGSWQVALRRDQVDLEDSSIKSQSTGFGEKVDSWTLGLSWWLNPNTRITANFIRSDYDRLDEKVNAFVIRFQYDF